MTAHFGCCVCVCGLWDVVGLRTERPEIRREGHVQPLESHDLAGVEHHPRRPRVVVFTHATVRGADRMITGAVRGIQRLNGTRRLGNGWSGDGMLFGCGLSDGMGCFMCCWEQISLHNLGTDLPTQINWEQVTVLEDSNRGSGGFGSTGKK